MTEELGKDIALEATKAVAVEVYKDVAQPTMKAVGSIVALPFQAIDAALLNAKLWVEEKHYNFERTRVLLAEKMKDVPPENIVSPENYVAVPAMKQIAYCFDSDELRDMYANLLANSMNSVVKNGVHPGFVEIIKQLCPDEAKILKHLSKNSTIPIITLRYENKEGGGIAVVKNFSNIGELADCERPYEINKYFNNLIRLGLISTTNGMSYLTNEKLYEPLENHKYITLRMNQIMVEKAGFSKTKIEKDFIELTDFGKAFCDICLNCQKVVIMQKRPD